MKKTLSITLNGIVFNVEEDAYNKLKEYLDSIKEYFGSYDDSQEILADIEARAAETFSGKINSTKQALTIVDIEELIKTMGTIEAIAGEEKKADSQKEQEGPAKSGPKKFYRNPDNAMILGVASGIAAYFNIDPLLVRLAFALSVLFGGTGIIIYIILCFIMPEAKTTGEKIKMRGEPVTLSSLKDAAMDKIETAKENIKKDRSLPKIMNAAQKIIKGFALAILIVIGVSFVVTAIAGLIGMFFVSGTIAFNANSPYLDFPLQDAFPGASLYLALTAATLVCIVPLIFLFILGLTMIRRKASINLAGSLLILMIWVIALTASGIFAIKFAPAFEERMQAFENSEKSTRVFDLKDFSKIDANDIGQIFISQGSEFKVEAQGLTRDIDRSSLTIENQTLKIKKNAPWQTCIFCFARKNPLTFKITMPSLEAYKANGFFKTEISGFTEKNMAIDIDGIGETKANIFAQELIFSGDGATKTILVGSSTLMRIDIDGVANLDAENFQSKEIRIEADGASRANIWATDKLEANSDGASRIFYKGTPEISERTRGASRLEAK